MPSMSAGDVPSPSQPCTSFVDDYSDCYPRGGASKRSSPAASRRHSRSPSPRSPRTRSLRSPQKSPPKSHWNPGGHPSCSPPPEPEAPHFGLIRWHKKGKGPPATRTVRPPPQPSRKFGQYDTNWEARYLSSHSWHRALHGGCAGLALPLSCNAGWSSYPATVLHNSSPSKRPSGKPPNSSFVLKSSQTSRCHFKSFLLLILKQDNTPLSKSTQIYPEFSLSTDMS